MIWFIIGVVVFLALSPLMRGRIVLSLVLFWAMACGALVVVASTVDQPGIFYFNMLLMFVVPVFVLLIVMAPFLSGRN